MAIYKVVVCPSCGFHQIFTGTKALRCQRCRKTATNFKILFQSPYPEKARRLLQQIKAKLER